MIYIQQRQKEKWFGFHDRQKEEYFPQNKQKEDILTVKKKRLE